MVLGRSLLRIADPVAPLSQAVGFEILVSESKARPLEHPELDASANSVRQRAMQALRAVEAD